MPTDQAPALNSSPGRVPLKRQLTSFVLVGAVSAVVDFGLLVILMSAGLGHTPAKALSWVAGTITAYLLNRRYTFRAAGSAKRFVAVMALYLITFAVQVGLFAVVYPVLLDISNRLIAQVVGFVIAQGVATVTNFVVQRAIIFGKD
ncbi:GtrA family protein [Enemella sp. A6]|uniref:GtrA family protein n=1 Tax=Enemella sp. A6 TaxID=3440152 RepID=UPI003EBF74E7